MLQKHPSIAVRHVINPTVTGFFNLKLNCQYKHTKYKLADAEDHN